MQDWTSGYVADIGYTYGYYPELNPLRTRLHLLHAGLAAPAVGTACELGYGQGMSVNFHAAGSRAQWWATDFNPAQAAFAKEIAGASGAGAHLFDDAFAEFCNRPELPEFDYIGLHGIWSWISDENRAVITGFLRRKLKVGGVLYISYNTLPGWATFAPARHLLTQHALALGAPGAGIVNRIDGSIEFAERLLATNPAYLRANPHVKERLEKVKAQNRHYLAHEYFNADWHPMYYADMARWLAPTKLSYACSAFALDHIEPLNLTKEQQAILAEIPDTNFRQTVRDYMVNQQFRRDYWVKGARRLTGVEQSEALAQTRVVLVTPRPAVSLKVQGALGEANMSAEVYNPILDVLADHKARSLGQIMEALKGSQVNFAQLVQAVIVLSGAGTLTVALEDAQASQGRRQTDKLNAHLMRLSRSSGDIAYLASPVTGGGLQVSRFAQLFLLARSEGHRRPEDWAKYVWNLLLTQRQRIVKDGKAIESNEDNLAELQRQATEFESTQLPVLKALMVA